MIFLSKLGVEVFLSYEIRWNENVKPKSLCKYLLNKKIMLGAPLSIPTHQEGRRLNELHSCSVGAVPETVSFVVQDE